MGPQPPSRDREEVLPDEGVGGDRPSDELLATLEEVVEEGEPVCDALSDTELNFRLPGLDNRERALPIRHGDLNRLLLAEPSLTADDRVKLEQLGRLLGATFHSEFYDRLRELKELYAPLDPDSDYVTLREHTRTLTEHGDEEFLAPFEAALIRANYRPLDPLAIKQAVSAPNEMGLTYVPDFNLFEHLRVYVRGYTKIVRTIRNASTRFRKRRVTLDAYQRLVVGLKFKPGLALGPFVRSDVFYLRMFKDVPHVDMEMHLPEQGTKVRMRWIDKAQIASPLMMGIPTLAMKLVAGFVLSPLALGGLMLAPLSAGVNSFFGFHRAKQKHLYAMIHKLYYLTLANNASVLTRLIDSAEEEEYKEAMLAYFFLWSKSDDGQPWSIPRLDDRIEAYLREKTGVEINFEVSDALMKLFRLGIAHRDPSGHVHATPIDQALQALDRRWDDSFRFA
jgi:hypothetical protein